MHEALMKKDQIDSLILSACVVVRESGYAAVMARATGDVGEGYSRMFSVWDHACRLLRQLSELDDSEAKAEQFIRDTWNPRTDLETSHVTG